MKKTNVMSVTELFNLVPMFQDIIKTLETKNFVDPGHMVPGVNKTIGVLSPLERAIYTVLDNSDEEFSKIGECAGGKITFNCLSESAFKLGLCPFMGKLKDMQLMYGSMKSLRDFMFALISSRLDAHTRGLDSVDLNSSYRITTSTEIETPETIELFEDWDKMSTEELLVVSLKDTFFETNSELIQKMIYVDESQDVLESDKVIRDMTEFEKVFWTMYSNKYNQLNIKEKELDELFSGDAFEKINLGFVSMWDIMFDVDPFEEGDQYRPKDENHSDVKKVEELSIEIQTMRFELNSMIDFFRSVIMSDIPKEDLDNYISQGVRKGFKVIVFDKK